MRTLMVVCITAALAAPAGAAGSAPIVERGGKPGAATSWSEEASQVVSLRLDTSYDPEEVSRAIEAGVRGAKAQPTGSSKVVVTGVPLSRLLRALERVDVDPVTDDIEAMLSAIQNPGGNSDGSGSSIRATKETDFSDVLGPPEALVAARVIKVRRARFPLVFVTVQVTARPKTREFDIRKGSKITVLPRVKSRRGVVDPEDKPSQLNVGAWYAQPGDSVKLRLEKAKRRGVFVARAFERIR